MGSSSEEIKVEQKKAPWIPHGVIMGKQRDDDWCHEQDKKWELKCRAEERRHRYQQQRLRQLERLLRLQERDRQYWNKVMAEQVTVPASKDTFSVSVSPRFIN
ncbi:unnamed protein product [Didymodactylos carnosus]|uniref:Uncharacterized protein n=1 Tax=Didymodactylos carnosus TaxID=1234261 RepID=A0A814CS39_9BILA|nr:unnamed protein product [Didymodactylos carnosus]CAF0961497.1 unnamed protein product [Didymodactylos carnosus]CAF3721248.1 unnamed protein product [Didymodactylos carnosus]CAF3734312.1 unnamed protein product [Didymodactylos carnosus]